jgi:hypothetical protein
MHKLMTILSTGLMAAIFLVNPVKADDDDSPKPPSKPAPKAAATALTDESLGVMLEQLGLEPKTQNDKNGDYYFINIEHNGWTLPYTVELSPNKKFVWISISILTLPEGQLPTGDVLQKLMEENDNLGPAKIAYRKNSRKIMLSLPLLNRGVTPAIFREQLNSLNNQTQTVSKLCEELRDLVKKDPVGFDDK